MHWNGKMKKIAEVARIQWYWLQELENLIMKDLFQENASFSIKTWNMDPFLL